MCGICGVVQLGTGPRRPVIAATVLDAMTDLMTHRGPSDRGTHVADGVALGVRRLSIVDVAGGHQPVSNEDGTVVAIQNGELYNHRDVRSRLKGHRFSRTATRRSSRTSTRSTGRGFRSTCAGCSGSPSGTSDAEACAGT